MFIESVLGGGRLFFHLNDLAIVNGYILFQEHCTNFPDEPALKQPATYYLVNIREDIMCGFLEHGPLPAQATPKPAPPSRNALKVCDRTHTLLW